MKWMSFVAVGALVLGSIGCGGETGTVKGKGDKKLTMTSPSDTSITQGETKDITVSITRTGFDEDVDLTFDKLPDGVSLKGADKKIAKGSTRQTFTLEASKDAKPVEGHVAQVSGKSGDMKVGPLDFKINVKKKE